MLHNILLQPNNAVTMAKHGRHVNVILASGVLRAIVRDVSGNTFETNLIAGMAFVNKEAFESVTFISETAQQTKIWIGDLPLNYSPDSIRSVGAGSLASSVAEAFSGEPQILLPAEVGRNKITLYSQTDNILIGGPNVNTMNGIPLVPGQAFQLEMQGAVYALETTGGFPPFRTAAVTDNDFMNPRTISGLTNNAVGYVEIKGGQVITKTFGGDRIFEVRNRQTMVIEQTINLSTVTFQDVYNNTLISDADYLYCCSNESNGSINFLRVNLDTLTPEKVSILPDTFVDNNTRRAGRYSKLGDRVLVVDTYNRKCVVSNDGGQTWTLGAGQYPGSAGSVLGAVILGDGTIVLCDVTNTYWSTDGGGTFTTRTGGTEAGVEGEAIAADADGAVYRVEKNANRLMKTLDGGVTWSEVLNFGDTGTFSWCEGVIAKGYTILCTSSNGYAYYTPNDGWIMNKLSSQPGSDGYASQRGSNIGDQGNLYIGYNYGDWLHIVDGEQVPSGGVKIAVMAEVN